MNKHIELAGRKYIESGSEADFNALYTCLRPLLTNMIKQRYKSIKSGDDINIIVSDVFIRMVRYRASFKPQYKFLNWIHSILTNCALNIVSKNNKRCYIFNYDVGLMGDVYTENIDDEELVNINALALKRWISKMPKEYRDLMLMKYYEEKTVAEMIQITGLSTNTIGTRINRATKILKGLSSGKLNEDFMEPKLNAKKLSRWSKQGVDSKRVTDAKQEFLANKSQMNKGSGRFN